MNKILKFVQIHGKNIHTWCTKPQIVKLVYVCMKDA